MVSVSFVFVVLDKLKSELVILDFNVFQAAVSAAAAGSLLVVLELIVNPLSISVCLIGSDVIEESHA